MEALRDKHRRRLEQQACLEGDQSLCAFQHLDSAPSNGSLTAPSASKEVSTDSASAAFLERQRRLAEAENELAALLRESEDNAGMKGVDQDDKPWRPPPMPASGVEMASPRPAERVEASNGTTPPGSAQKQNRWQKRRRHRSGSQPPSRGSGSEERRKRQREMTAEQSNWGKEAAAAEIPLEAPPGNFQNPSVPVVPTSNQPSIDQPSKSSTLSAVDDAVLSFLTVAVSKAAGIETKSQDDAMKALQALQALQQLQSLPPPPLPGAQPSYGHQSQMMPMPHQAHQAAFHPSAYPGYPTPPPQFQQQPFSANGSQYPQHYMPAQPQGYYMPMQYPQAQPQQPCGYSMGYGPPPQGQFEAKPKEYPAAEESKGRGKGTEAKPKEYPAAEESKGRGKGTEANTPPEKLSGNDWEEPRSKTGLKLIGDQAPSTCRWTYPLKDESRRSFAGYLENFLSESQCKSFFEQIRDGTEWFQPESKLGQIPRKTSWLVNKGCSCVYRYGGIEVEPKEFPKWMTDLMDLTMPSCGLARSSWPNSCNLNLYEDGGMTVGWHSDDEKLFQGKYRDCRIISLSLGAKRKFELRLNWPEDSEQSLRSVTLSGGDLLTMEGMVQKHFQHRVPREDNITEPRINLTWRWVKRHLPRCPAGRSRN